MAITKISPDVVDFDAGITISTADNTDTLTLTSTDADANAGPNLRLYRNSGTPADSDVLGLIDFEGRNDNTQDVVYAGIDSRIVDASDGTEDGRLEIVTMLAGTAGTSRILMDATETVFNDNSKDLDFRVEGDGNTHALFVQASDDKIGLGHSAPPNRLTILGDKDQTSSGVYAANTKWGLLAETPNYADGDYVGLIASTTADNNATKPKFGIWGLHAGSGSKMYFGVSNNYGSGLNVNWALNENGHFGPLAAGHGIDFSVTSDGSGTDTSEVFDDYEEGTWTPVMQGSTTNGSPTMSNQNGSYTKVGRIVHLTFHLTVTNLGSAAGGIQISGIPYNTASNSNKHITAGSCMVDALDFHNSYYWIVPYASDGVSLITLYMSGDNVGWTPPDVDGSFGIIGSLSYIAA